MGTSLTYPVEEKLEVDKLFVFYAGYPNGGRVSCALHFQEEREKQKIPVNNS